MANEIHILSVLLAFVSLLSAAALIPFIFFSKLIAERYDRLFKAYIIGLFSMLVLDIAYVVELFGHSLLYKLFELLSLALFIVAAVVIIKNSATLYVLLEQKKGPRYRGGEKNQGASPEGKRA